MPAAEDEVRSPASGASKFRHVFGQSWTRSECYEWGAGRATCLAVNPKFLCAALEGSAGGQVIVCRAQDSGKYAQTKRLSDHKAPVTDVKWNSFNDNVLATASSDNSVKVWHVRDDCSGECVRTLVRHSRKVEQIEWHNTVDDVILSMGSDSRIVLWDVANDHVLFEISEFTASSICFSPNSALFAATSRVSHRVTVFDARTGDAKKSALMPHDGIMAPKALFSSNKNLITYGNTKSNRRQFAIFNLSSFSAPVQVVDIDGASGQLYPLFDIDLNILYITGKGDTVVRFYELFDRAPFVSYLAESQQPTPHTAVATVPKRALSFSSCEVFRLYRLHPQSLMITPLAFIVPRREDHFHSDLYPPTRGPTPSLSLAEWRAGLDLAPVQLQLCPGMPIGTCKPVQLKRAGELVTADLNNDRKFRFLSQATKPDYRVISEREDCEVILKMEEIKSKLHESKENSVSSIEYRSEEEIDATTASQISLDPPVAVVQLQSQVTPPRSLTSSQVSSDFVLQDADTSRKTPFALVADGKNVVIEETQQTTKIYKGSPISIASAPVDRDSPFPSFQNSPAKTSPIQIMSNSQGQSAPLATLEDDSPGDFLEEEILFTKKTNENSDRRKSLLQEVIDEDIASLPGTSTDAELKVISHSASLPPVCGKEKSRSRSASAVRHLPHHISRGSSASKGFSREPSQERNVAYDIPKWTRPSNGLTPQFPQRCVAMNIEEQEITEYNGNQQENCSESRDNRSKLLEDAVSILERELRRSDAKSSQLERLVVLQQQDIDSLRFEIEWKDERISFLQSELAKVEARVSPEEQQPSTPS